MCTSKLQTKVWNSVAYSDASGRLTYISGRQTPGRTIRWSQSTFVRKIQVLLSFERLYSLWLQFNIIIVQNKKYLGKNKKINFDNETYIFSNQCHVHCASPCKVRAPTDRKCRNECKPHTMSKNPIHLPKTPYLRHLLCMIL
jgi:hypothetical protein